MRVRAYTIEYNLTEASCILGISPVALKQAVDAGYLRCYYKRGKNNYQFHEASLHENQELLAQKAPPAAHPPVEITSLLDV